MIDKMDLVLENVIFIHLFTLGFLIQRGLNKRGGWESFKGINKR